MKKLIFSLFLALLILAAATALADTDGNYTYDVDQTSGNATITGYSGTDTSLTIPDTLGGSQGNPGYPVTVIGPLAFATQTDLEAVEIPETVTDIQAGAFSGCSALESVIIKNDVNQNGVKHIGDSAFDGTAIGTIEIPASVQEIGNDVFKDCYDLTDIYLYGDSITLGGGLSLTAKIYVNPQTNLAKTISEYQSEFRDIGDPNDLWSYKWHTGGAADLLEATAYRGNEAVVTVPGGVHVLGENLFQNNMTITEVSLPNTLKQISGYAFSHAEKLTGIDVPYGVTELGERAFEYCLAMTSVKLPESLKILRDYTFDGCMSVSGIELPDHMTFIGERVLGNWGDTRGFTVTIGSDTCALLQDYYFYDKADPAFRYCWGDQSVQGVPGNTVVVYNGTEYIELTGIQLVQYTGTDAHVTVPSFVQSISHDVFTGDTLEWLTVQEGVLSINTFLRPAASCSNLTRLDLPNSLLSVGSLAFYYCPIQNLTIPDTILGIGEQAFRSPVYCSLTSEAAQRVSQAGISFIDPNPGSAHPNLANCEVRYIWAQDGTESLKFYRYHGNEPYLTLDDMITAIEYETGAHTSPAYNEERLNGTRLLADKGSDRAYMISSCGYSFAPDTISLYDYKYDYLYDPQGALVLSHYYGPVGTISSLPADAAGVLNNCFGAGENSYKYYTASGNSYDPAEGITFVCDAASQMAKQLGYGDYVFHDPDDPAMIMRWNEAGDKCFLIEYKGTAETLAIPEGVTDIARQAFQYDHTSQGYNYNTTLKSIQLPGTIRRLHDYAMYACKRLEAIMMPEGLTTIGQYAINCAGTVTLPDSVTTLGENAVNAQRIYIGGGIQNLNLTTVYAYTGLYIPATVTSISGDWYSPRIHARAGSYAAQWASTTPAGDPEGTVFADWNDDGILYQEIDDNGTTVLELHAYTGNGGIATLTEAPDTITDAAVAALRGVRIISDPASPTAALLSQKGLSFTSSATDEWDYRLDGSDLYAVAYHGTQSILTAIPAGAAGIRWDSLPADTKFVCAVNSAEAQQVSVFYTDAASDYALTWEGSDLKLLKYTGNATKISQYPADITAIAEDAFDRTMMLTARPTDAAAILLGEAGYSFRDPADNGIQMRKTYAAGCTVETYTGDRATVEIPYGVTAIAAHAFDPDPEWGGVYDQAMTDIILPAGLERIGAYAFRNREGLAEISIPDSVTDIGEYAFTGCGGLREIHIGRGVTSLAQGVFDSGEYADAYIPATMTAAGAENYFGVIHAETGSFASHLKDTFTDLNDADMVYRYAADANGQEILQLRDYLGTATHIALNPDVQSIYPGFGRSVRFLASAGTPEAQMISDSGFTFTPNTTDDWDYRYENGELLAKQYYGTDTVIRTMPGTATGFAPGALQGKTVITGLNTDLAKAAGKIGVPFYADDDREYRLQWNAAGTELTYSYYNGNAAEVTVPEGVTVIQNAFGGTDEDPDMMPMRVWIVHTNPQKVILPATIRAIGSSSFVNVEVQELVIPEGLETIYSGAFFNTTLSTVTLPDSLQTIEDGAFRTSTGPDDVFPVNQNPSVIANADTYAARWASTQNGGFRDRDDVNNQYVWEGTGNDERLVFLGTTGTDPFIALNPLTGSIRNPVTGYRLLADENSDLAQWLSGIGLSFTPDRISEWDYRKIDGKLWGAKYYGTQKEITALPAGMEGILSGALPADAKVICSQTDPMALKVADGFYESAISEWRLRWDNNILTIAKYDGNTAEITDIPSGVGAVDANAFASTPSFVCGISSDMAKTVSALGYSFYTDGTHAFLMQWQGNSLILQSGALATGTVTIPDDVTEIAAEAFRNNGNITTITVPGSVLRIGEYAFQNCSALRQVTLNTGLEEIAGYAFADDSLLTELRVPDSVTTLGAAIMESGNLFLPDNISTMNGKPYAGTYTRLMIHAESVTAQTLGQNGNKQNYYTYYGECRFRDPDDNYIYAWLDGHLYLMQGYSYGQSTYDNGSYYPDETMFNSHVYGIKDNDTHGRGIRNLVLPETVRDLWSENGTAMFSENESITFPEGLTTIPANICTSEPLHYIIVPRNVISINDGAFGESLTTVYGYSGTEAEDYASRNGIDFIDLDSFDEDDATITPKQQMVILHAGETADLNELLYIDPVLGIPYDLSATSSDTAVVTVSGSTITAAAGGSARVSVWVTGHEITETWLYVTVYNEVTDFDVPEGDQYIDMRNGKQFEVTNISPDNADPNFVWTDSAGNNHGTGSSVTVYLGSKVTRIITVTSHNGISKTFKAIGYDKLGAITLTANSTMLEGEYQEPTVKVKVDSTTRTNPAGLYSLTSSDDTIVTVTADGKIRATGEGTATITAQHIQDMDGSMNKTVTITVTKPTTMILPTALKTIEENAFDGIAAQRVIIPEGVTAIGDEAFANSSNLLMIVIPDSVKTFGQNIFAGSPQVTIYCPSGADAETYAAAHGIPCVTE